MLVIIFSSGYGTVEAEHMLDNTYLNNYKRIKITESLFSNHKEAMLEISSVREPGIRQHVLINQSWEKSQ